MEAQYKEHRVVVIAQMLPQTQEWVAETTVEWTEAGRMLTEYLSVAAYFDTRTEAEREGLAFAKKWIDSDKVQLRAARS
jgi:hypothetical protein